MPEYGGVTGAWCAVAAQRRIVQDEVLIVVFCVSDSDPVRGACCSPGARWLFVMVLIVLLCGMVPVCAVAVEQAGVKVTAIEIRGNKRIELPAIAGRLTL